MCNVVVGISWGQVSDFLRRRKLVTTTMIRKINTVLGEYYNCVTVVLATERSSLYIVQISEKN